MVRPRLRPEQGDNSPQTDFFPPAPTQAVEKPEPLPLARTSADLGRYNGGVSFVIRDFKAEDFETLWRIDQECFPPGISYSRPELKAYIRHRGSFTLIASDTEKQNIGGFLVAHGGPIGHIVTIDVIAAARRSGVGSLLLRSAEEKLQAAGSRAVGLETAVDNTSALAFYKRHGYSVIRTWPRYYSNGVDALVLRKALAGNR